MILIEYPKCSTCQKAKKFLIEKGIDFEDRDIVVNKNKEKELKKWIKLSNKEVSKWFNTTGIKYRELNLKEKLKTMTDEEKIELLSTDGKLIKRPVLIGNDFVLNGFKEKEWNELV